MSSARTVRLIEDAYRNDDIQKARDAIYEYYAKNCLHPFYQQINDAHFGLRSILVPCGRCIHCMETKINEWCTRMYAHAEDFKNVYFVTLTYRSITDAERPVNKLLLNKLTQAVWHRDSKNYTHHLSYNPCLLVKDHYQKFLKRLRKNTGFKDITYVLSGEYGSKFGRPHFHLILFTNGTLTKRDIVRAWSVCLWQNNKGEWSYRTNQRSGGVAYDFPIGSVDFHDLVSNGTFNTTAKIKVDGTYMNAANCFSYVAKYVVKRDTPNLKRVSLAYYALYHKETRCRLFESEVALSVATNWLLDHGYTYEQADDIYNNHLKQLSYEKTIFEPCESVFKYGLLRSKRVEKNGAVFTYEFYSENYFEFCEFFRPFCEFSRGVPIGSVYAKRNIQEFAQGIFTKPILQNSGFVVPSYFRTKAQQYLYGFREVHHSIQGDSFALGNLTNLLGCFEEYTKNRTFSIPYSTITDARPFYLSALYVQPTLFADVYSGERITFREGFADHWKYSRSGRKYELTRAVPIADFIRYWTARLLDDFNRAAIQMQASKDNMHYRDRAILTLTDMGDDESTISKRFADLQRAYLDEASKLYHSSHSSAE